MYAPNPGTGKHFLVEGQIENIFGLVGHTVFVAMTHYLTVLEFRSPKWVSWA